MDREPIQPRKRGRRASAGRRRRPAAAAAAAGMAELSHMALWMTAVLAGMVTAALAARAPFFRALMKRCGLGGTCDPGGRAASRPRRPTREQSLPLLAEAIVGSSKSAVASVFGPPRSAVLRGAVAIGAGSPAYWQADTWYYPLPKNDQLAMAIEFTQDFAREVEFFRAPRG